MASLNKAILIGHLGNDPEVRYAPSGDAICNFSIATTETWKDKASGERREAAEWHRISMFGKLAEIAGQYLKKGSQVYIEGRIQTRKWQDKDGNDRYTTEIRADQMKMLGGRPEGGNDTGGRPPADSQPRAAAPRQQSAPQRQAPAQSSGGGGFGDFSDDIPFAYIGRGMASHII